MNLAINLVFQCIELYQVLFLYITCEKRGFGILNKHILINKLFFIILASSMGTPKTPRTQVSSQQSQGTPKSQPPGNSSQSTTQSNGLDEMMDDDFDITEAEMSMQADR